MQKPHFNLSKISAVRELWTAVSIFNVGQDEDKNKHCFTLLYVTFCIDQFIKHQFKH